MKKFLRLLGIAALMAAVFGFLACSDDGGSSGGGTSAVKVSKITLSPAEKSIKAGATFTISATVEPENATEKGVNWKSGDEAIATVSENGTVTAVANGEVKIIATAKDGSGVKGECAVTVSDEGEDGDPPQEGDPQEDDETDWFAVLTGREDNLLTETFEGKTELSVFEGFGGETGVYVTDVTSSSGVNTYEGSVAEGNYKIEDGVLTVGGSGKNTAAVIDFGDDKAEIEGCFEFSVTEANGNNINFFKDENAIPLRLVLNAKLGCYKDYKNDGTAGENGTLLAEDTKPAKPADFDISANTSYKFYYKFDLVAKKMTIKINGTAIFDNVDTEIDSLAGVSINTSNSGKRKNVIKNIALCGTYSEAALALKAAKDLAVKELEAYGANADASLTESIATARANGKAAINSAKTEDAVTTALGNAKQTIDDIIASLTQTPEQARDEHLAEVAAYANEVKVGFDTTLDTAISGMIDDVVTEKTNEINAITTSALDVINAIAAAKEAIDEKAAERRATKFTVTYNTNGGSEIAAGSVQYGNRVSKPAKNPTKDGNRFVMWTATDSGSEDYFAEVDGVPTRPAIYADVTIYASWRTPDATLTFGSKTISAFTGDKYGDYSIPVPVATTMGKKAEWSSAVDLDAIITGDASFSVTEGDWKSNEELTQASFSGDALAAPTNGILVSGNLFDLKTADAMAVTNTNAAQAIDGVSFSKGLATTNVEKMTNSVPTKSPSVVLVAKEKIKVTAYLGLADSQWKSNRSGLLYYKKGTAAEVQIADGSNTKVTGKQVLELNAGDVVEFYAYNKDTSSGSRLWLFGIDATVSDDFSNMNVISNKNSSGNETVAWSTLKGGDTLKALAESKSDTKGDDAFVGWATTNGGDVVSDWSAVTLTAGTPLNLYSKFETANVTINYYEPDANNANFSVKNTVKGLAGTKTVKPDDPTLAGYRFKGWYTEQAFTNLYDFDSTLAEGTLDLYAKFVKLYTVTFNANGGSEVAAATVEDGATVTEPTPTKSGKEFGGWFTDSDCTEGNEFDFDTAITENTTLYAKWNDLSANLVDRLTVSSTAIAKNTIVFTNTDLGISWKTVSQSVTITNCSDKNFEADGISFKKVLKAGNGNSAEITLTKAAKLTVYALYGDSSYTLSSKTTVNIQLKDSTSDVVGTVELKNETNKGATCPVGKIEANLGAGTYTLASDVSSSAKAVHVLGIFVD